MRSKELDDARRQQALFVKSVKDIQNEKEAARRLLQSVKDKLNHGKPKNEHQ